MKIIALILFLLLSAASLHAADKPVKVYSAHELQKIADGIYREMNNQGQEEQVEVNLLKNPSEAVTLKANPLKQIEKALEADNQDALRQIYHSAVSASSGETENKVSQPVAVTAPVRPAAPEVPAVVSRPAVRRADSRLDAWIRRQSGTARWRCPASGSGFVTAAKCRCCAGYLKSYRTGGRTGG